MAGSGSIRVGVGGWVYEPWRGVFYPDDLSQKKELAYMSRRVTAIEINSTYYGSQKPATFAKWRDDTPDDFVFTAKGNRFCTNRRELADAGDSIKRFFDQGITELGAKLGPIVWQLAPTKKFDEADFGAFLELLPAKADGLSLRHAIEARHDSFRSPAFIALLRRFDVAVVLAEHASYPGIPDVTGPFVYARLQTGSDDEPLAYPPKALDMWAERFKTWAGGGEPDGLDLVDPAHPATPQTRDVFAFVIHEGKLRAPAGAGALVERLGPGHAAAD